MKPQTTLRLLLGALILLLSGAPAAADTTPEARKWLEKLLSVYDQGPFKVGYNVKLDMAALGQPHGGYDNGLPRQAAISLVSQLQAANRSGHADRFAVVPAFAEFEHPFRGRRGRGLAIIDADRWLSIGRMDHHEASSSDVPRLGPGHCQ